MARFLFVPHVLELIANGTTFRWVIAWILRVGAAGLGLVALLSWIGLWEARI
jgi:hypothetical protein